MIDNTTKEILQENIIDLLQVFIEPLIPLVFSVTPSIEAFTDSLSPKNPLPDRGNVLFGVLH